MIFKDSKEAVESDIHARGLDHLAIKGFDLDSAGGNFRLNVAIAQ
jgi:hypothetical protein